MGCIAGNDKCWYLDRYGKCWHKEPLLKYHVIDKLESDGGFSFSILNKPSCGSYLFCESNKYPIPTKHSIRKSCPGCWSRVFYYHL